MKQHGTQTHSHHSCWPLSHLLSPGRELIHRISFKHGGPEFDSLYPEGIPTQVEIEFETSTGIEVLDSGVVLYPLGHCRNENKLIEDLLMQKFIKLGILALSSSINKFIDRLQSLGTASADELLTLYDLDLAMRAPVD